MKRPYIIVDREQASVIRNAGRSVEVRGPDGKMVGYIDPWPSEEEIAIVKKRLAEGADEPCYTTEEVFEHLRSLEQQSRGQRPDQH
ncbi:MAG: hypothetical protein B7Z73_01370 [Planctomycetia bacterium 21-64-5]|nr:MAG: hypothetical protein B7Z73_01370 [Planctomycetia bacterium 21-64-5]HQU42944.1 hypothetical protein [Pirellulales bacterium]